MAGPAPRIEICIDCTDPVSLAPFWAAVLGYEVGQPDEPGTYLRLIAPAGQPEVLFQRVREARAVKNRLHLDLWTTTPGEMIRRAVDLGAARLGDEVVGTSGHHWQVLADPAGNEFCICSEDAILD